MSSITNQAGRTYFDNPGEALRQGKGKYAIADISLGHEYTGKMIVVFPKVGQNYIAYAGSPGLPIRRASTQEVDRACNWKSV